MRRWLKILLVCSGVALAVAVVGVGIIIRLNPGLPLSDVGLQPDVAGLSVPPGFSVATYAGDVEGARSLALGERGTVFVGSRGPGRVYALVDADQDGRAERTLVVAEGLHSPNGVAVHDGALFVAEISRVLRIDDIESWVAEAAVSAAEDGSATVDPPLFSVVDDSFPAEEMHGWKFIGFGPDGRLYVPVGAPCNSCESADERFATIMRMEPDGTGLEIFARGVRNTVGFDWHPRTGELWFTDNGRDWLGDDQPPDELNRAPEPGLHFGFPYVHGGDLPDPDLTAPPGLDFTPPVQKLGAHVASLGMRFSTGAMFPAEYRGGVFIAEHGSWNRSSPAGYRVTYVGLEGDRAVSYEPFVTGFERDRQAWGRPVDVQVMPDGALLVSDDRAGAVYRVTYSG